MPTEFVISCICIFFPSISEMSSGNALTILPTCLFSGCGSLPLPPGVEVSGTCTSECMYIYTEEFLNQHAQCTALPHAFWLLVDHVCK